MLPVLLRRVMPADGGGNADVFGLWHVRQTLDAMRLNGVPTTSAPAPVHVASNSGGTELVVRKELRTAARLQRLA